MDKKYTTTNARQTQRIGRELAGKILKMPPGKTAVVLSLYGNLGSGKTTFLQGFAKGLGIKEKILSPTFVIMKRFKNFYHVDCYRINKAKEISELGFKEIISNPQNIVAIEWPEKIYPVKYLEEVISPRAKLFNQGKKSLPPPTFIINFKFINKNTREILIK